MTEDVVFRSCEPMFHGRSARFTQSDAGEVDRQPKVGNLRTSRSRTWTRKVRLVAWFPILVSVFFRGASACGQSPSNVKPTAQPKAVASEHVGSLACAECHKQIYNGYSQTGMGRAALSVGIRARLKRKGDLPRHSRREVDYRSWGERARRPCPARRLCISSAAVFLLQSTALGV